MAIRCRLCGRSPNEVGGILHRVNEKGVIGIWECRPICGAEMNNEDAIIAAIEGVFNEEPISVTLESLVLQEHRMEANE